MIGRVTFQAGRSRPRRGRRELDSFLRPTVCAMTHGRASRQLKDLAGVGPRVPGARSPAGDDPEGDAARSLFMESRGLGKTALLDHAVNSATKPTALFYRGQRNRDGEAPSFRACRTFSVRRSARSRNSPNPNVEQSKSCSDAGTARLPTGSWWGWGCYLLSELSTQRPVVCVVDDTQWLDASSAQAISFAARHISKDAVAFVFGA